MTTYKINEFWLVLFLDVYRAKLQEYHFNFQIHDELKKSSTKCDEDEAIESLLGEMYLPKSLCSCVPEKLKTRDFTELLIFQAFDKYKATESRVCHFL